jgi:hypothetical protein
LEAAGADLAVFDSLPLFFAENAAWSTDLRLFCCLSSRTAGITSNQAVLIEWGEEFLAVV